MLDVQIAAVCHEANAAYCRTLGDDSQPRWEDAPQWQRASALEGVEHAKDPRAKPEDSHEHWRKGKLAAGWKYGPVKDPDNLEHPCIMPFNKLPLEQQKKDILFLAVARALL